MCKFQAVLVSKDYYRSSLQYQLRVPGKKLGFITLVSLILLGAPCSKLLASQAQLSATTPPGLESAENSIVEAEEFNDSYAKAVASLNDAAIQKLDLQRSALQKKLIAANADLGRYLKAHPKDVNGLLMLVRFDQAKQWLGFLLT